MAGHHFIHPSDAFHHGDAFKDGQYRAVRELGEGSSSTVWLAVDGLNSRYVVLKIMEVESSVVSVVETELSIYARLKQVAPEDPLSEHVLMLLDSFEHVGPYGTHRCHVFEPMGADTASMVHALPCNQPGWNNNFNRYPESIRYPKSMARKILKDALSGIAFLHKNGVTHGDMQPGNLLFSTHPLRSINEETEFEQYEDYYLEQNTGVDMAIKVSDLGAAFYSDDPPQSTKTPLGLRAPELIIKFQDRLDSSIDIWAFGCLIYEFFTRKRLFPLNFYDDDEVDDIHLLYLHDVLQPLSDTWMAKWPNARRYFGRTGKLLYPISDETWKLKQEKPYVADPLEKVFDKHRPDDMDDNEARVITTLIRRILQYEPSQRPTAVELLEDPWFQAIENFPTPFQLRHQFQVLPAGLPTGHKLADSPATRGNSPSAAIWYTSKLTPKLSDDKWDNALRQQEPQNYAPAPVTQPQRPAISNAQTDDAADSLAEWKA